MTVEEFFNLFIEELKENKSLHYYYKFLQDPSKFEYRKAYFCQRLQYIADNISNAESKIWDCGCGFGTTAIFLSLNGYTLHGTTLEHYIKEIPRRLDYWRQYGDISRFSYSYENLFDYQFDPASYDFIIIQDTLHHLEPINEAIGILKRVLKKNGRLLIIEENGSNIIQNAKLFIQRGNKKIIEIYDEHLRKKIKLGNENIRSLNEWRITFEKHDMAVIDKSVQYIRYYLPFAFPNSKAEEKLKREQEIWRSNQFLKEYFFFGINFLVKKS